MCITRYGYCTVDKVLELEVMEPLATGGVSETRKMS